MEKDIPPKSPENTKETLEEIDCTTVEKLRQLCADDTKSTIRIPMSLEDFKDISEKDFAQWVYGTIDAAVLLALQSIQRIESRDTRVIYENEFFKLQGKVAAANGLDANALIESIKPCLAFLNDLRVNYSNSMENENYNHAQELLLEVVKKLEMSPF